MSYLTRSVIAALAATTMVTGTVVAGAAAATIATIVVSPNGSDLSAGDLGHPVATLAKAQEMARGLSDKTDVVVQLAGGVHRLTKPLEFTAADSGRNGHTVTWQPMSGVSAEVSGGQPVTGWTLQDSNANVWVASVARGADSRQLYVDGALAPRASMPLSRNDVQITTTGMTIRNSALNFLATLPQQNRIAGRHRWGTRSSCRP